MYWISCHKITSLLSIFFEERRRTPSIYSFIAPLPSWPLLHYNPLSQASWRSWPSHTLTFLSWDNFLWKFFFFSYTLFHWNQFSIKVIILWNLFFFQFFVTKSEGDSFVGKNRVCIIHQINVFTRTGLIWAYAKETL